MTTITTQTPYFTVEQASRWLTTRGWQTARTMDARGWKPPEGYELPGESNVVVLNPFAKVGN